MKEAVQVQLRLKDYDFAVGVVRFLLLDQDSSSPLCVHDRDRGGILCNRQHCIRATSATCESVASCVWRNLLGTLRISSLR